MVDESKFRWKRCGIEQRWEGIGRLLPALIAAGFVYVVSPWTHPHPAFGAWLSALTTEQVAEFQWHLAAGGIVRVPVATFLITGLYSESVLSSPKRPRWPVDSMGLSGLVLPIHSTGPTSRRR